jgi:ribosome biogenesis SPOUT family RNA methylase Rps3
MSDETYKYKYIKQLEDHSSMEKQFLKMEIEIDLLKNKIDNDKIIIADLRKNQKLKPEKKTIC